MLQSWLLSAAFIGLIGESAVRCWQDSEAVAAVSGAGGKLAAVMARMGCWNSGLAIAVFSSVRRSAALLAGLLVPFPVSCDGAAERFCEEHRPVSSLYRIGLKPRYQLGSVHL